MDCNEVWPDPGDIWRRAYAFFLLATTYLIPLFVLSLTYGSVIRKLWLHTAPGNADTARDLQQLRSKRKVPASIKHLNSPLHDLVLWLTYYAWLACEARISGQLVCPVKGRRPKVNVHTRKGCNNGSRRLTMISVYDVIGIISPVC